VSKTTDYINNALIPMLEGLDHNDNLIGWEVMNEPEWLTEGGKVTVS